MELYSAFFLLLLFLITFKTQAEIQYYPSNENIFNLKENEFKEKVLEDLTDQIWLVKFYAPWCGHCRHLYPEILKVSEHFKDNKKVKIAKVDCSVETKICKEQNIVGYPTMRTFSKGQFIKQYKRPRRTHLDIIKFIERGIQPEINKIQTFDEINKLSNDLLNYPILLIMFNSETEIEENLQLLEEIVKKNDFEVTIAVTYAKNVKDQILENTKGHKFSNADLCSNSPCITLIGKDNFSPSIVLVKETEFIVNFIQQYRFPFLNAPSRMDFIEQLNSGNLIVIMGIKENVKVNKEISGDFITDFGLIAEKVRREFFLPIKFSDSENPRGIIFSIVDFETYSSLFREFGITEFNFIQGYEIVVADGLKYYYNRPDMMKIPILLETIKLICNQDSKVPRLKAYSVFNLNTVKRFLYDLNVLISDIFYKSWLHAAGVTIIAFLIVAGLTIFCCLIFFGDLADSYLLHDDQIVTEMQKMAPNVKNKSKKNKDEKSENELDNSSLSDIVHLSDEEPELEETRKER